MFAAVAAAFPLLLLAVARLWAKTVQPPRPGPVKNSTYECGLPAEGDVWIQFKAHYYLYAILFLIFDAEALFLLPAAAAFTSPAGAVPADSGPSAKPEPFPACGDIPDIEREELRRRGILVTCLEELYGWGRANSIWPLQFGLACCAIEMIAAPPRASTSPASAPRSSAPPPRQADLMIVSGTATNKMAPQVVRLWNQMPEPKYCIAMGACSISGGPFKQGYNVLKGIDRFIPVDIYIPGCPPRPEALLNGLAQLQEKIRAERVTGEHAARHLRPAASFGADEVPVPECVATDLVPPFASGAFRPPTPPALVAPSTRSQSASAAKA